MVEYKVKVCDAYTIWYNLDGERHRTDGPAVDYASGYKAWYLKGKLHREDGPACEYADGTKYWFLKGKRLTEKEFNKRLKSDPCDGKVIEVDGKKYKLVKEKS